MKKLQTALLAGLATVIGGVGTATAQDEGGPPQFVPVELYACSYRDRQDQGDYDDALDQMKQWMQDHEGAEPYAAWRMFPVYFGPDQEFDFIYFGAWQNGSSMGRDLRNYWATANAATAAWDDAVDCAAQVMFASINVKQPPEDSGRGEFVLTVSDCKLAHGRQNAQALAALREYGQYRTDNGSPGGTWAWFPAYGGGDADYDFKLVNSHSDAEAFGNHFQWFGDNQAFMKLAALTDGLVECDDARVYSGETIVNTWPEM